MLRDSFIPADSRSQARASPEAWISPTPPSIIRCFVPDGINLLSAHLQDITVRRSRTGPVFGNVSVIHGDASFLAGDFGPVSFMHARIDGTLDLTGARILDVEEDAV